MRTEAAPRTQRKQRSQRLGRTCVRVLASVFFVTLVSFVPSRVAHGQMASGPATAGYKQEPGLVSTALPKALREIGFDQNIDQRVPLDTMFRDESGAAVRLGEYFGKK